MFSDLEWIPYCLASGVPQNTPRRKERYRMQQHKLSFKVVDRACVTRRVVGDWEVRLRGAGFDLVLPKDGPDAPMPREEFLGKVAGCAGVLSMLTDRWDAEAFEAAGPGLRIVANYAVGYNNVDLAEATRRGVIVTNTPDVLTEATADTAWALVMMASRRLGEAERHLRAGRFHGWGPNDWIGVDLRGRTLGIIGAGRIGEATARRARAWNMRIVYSHQNPKPDFEAATGGSRVPLDQLLSESDFVSLHVPFTDKTRHLIGARELTLMKPTAILVNTARGPIVDEAALVVALRERRLYAAGLDVYEDEPRLAPGLVELENVVLLPHVGSGTPEAREGMARVATDNLLAVLAGKPPINPVTP